jgi:hypothetical protein
MYIYIIIIIVILIILLYFLKYYNKLYYESFINSETSETSDETSEENTQNINSNISGNTVSGSQSEESTQNINSNISGNTINDETSSAQNEESNSSYPQNVYNTNNVQYSSKSTISKINQVSTEENKICDVGFPCFNSNGFGTYNNNCDCISSKNKKLGVLNSEQEEGRNMLQEENNIFSSKAGTQEEQPYIPPNCIPNQDFSQYCKNISSNPNMGVNSVTPCNNTSSQVQCGLFNIGGNILKNNTIMTPCLDKSTDFDTWCKYYNKKPIPNGYNVNSIGAKDILIGSDGDCYNSDGTSNDNLARAICDNSHMQTITKLEPDNQNIDYNYFTECLPLNKTNFAFSCTHLFKGTIPDQILGYDCNPGYGRAKCIKPGDIINNNNLIYNEFNTNVLSSSKPRSVSNCCNGEKNKKINKPKPIPISFPSYNSLNVPNSASIIEGYSLLYEVTNPLRKKISGFTYSQNNATTLRILR